MLKQVSTHFFENFFWRYSHGSRNGHFSKIYPNLLEIGINMFVYGKKLFLKSTFDIYTVTDPGMDTFLKVF